MACAEQQQRSGQRASMWPRSGERGWSAAVSTDSISTYDAIRERSQIGCPPLLSGRRKTEHNYSLAKEFERWRHYRRAAAARKVLDDHRPLRRRIGAT